MDQFRTVEDSHAHSREILDLIYQYDSFLDSLTVIADMGCGSGLDINWWANLTTRDDPPEPRNYICYAIDRDTSQIDPNILKNKNVAAIQADFEDRMRIRPVDFLWSHNSFQYALNPMNTLNSWNKLMNVNGMMVLTVPLHQGYQYNRLVTRSINNCFYHYNVCNLMYMLAVSGFDCRDCFVNSTENSPWLTFAVYKNEDPLDPATTTWFELAERNLVNDSVIKSLNKYGHVRQEELIFTWLDKDFHFARN